MEKWIQIKENYNFFKNQFFKKSIFSFFVIIIKWIIVDINIEIVSFWVIYKLLKLSIFFLYLNVDEKCRSKAWKIIWKVPHKLLLLGKKDWAWFHNTFF